MNTITMKDRRILDLLDKDPNMSIADIARKALTSKQVVEYRIKRMLNNKTIYSFFPIINPSKLGYSLFRAHIKLKNVNEEKYTLFAKSLFEEYPTFWIGFISGSFDIILDLWAKNITDFYFLMNKVTEKHKSIIASYELFPMIYLQINSYGYFLDKPFYRGTVIYNQQNKEEVDDKDILILKKLKTNSRLSYEEIGRGIGLTRNSIKNRISRLEKQGIITGYNMMVNFKQFDRLSYKLFITYENSEIKQENELLSYLKTKSGILSYAKLLGKWNLDIELQPRSAKELQQFLIELRSKFVLIKDLEVIQIIEDYGIDYYPDNLT